MTRLPPLHPWLLALLPVVSMYAANVGQGQGQELLVTAGMALLAAAALYGAAFLLYRDARKTALLVSAFLLLFLGYDTLFGDIDRWQIGGKQIGRQRYALLLSYGALTALAVALYRTRRSLATLTALATVVAAGMLVHPLATVAPAYIGRGVAPGSAASPLALPQGTRKPDPLPDIYYLILDRYADGETIRASYGYDNSAFYQYLTDKGFYIARDSRTNYIKTGLSLASSLNLTPLDPVVHASPDSTDWAVIYDMLADHTLGRFLKAQGYAYVHVGSWWWPTRANPNATRNINSYPFTPRPLMVLLNSGLVAPIVRRSGSPWLDDRRQLWSRLNRNLAELATVPATSGPKFVLAHVLLPHPPYVFKRDGSFLPSEEEARTTDRQGYVNQLIATNAHITAVIDRVLADSKQPPIIVLQGDEGPYPEGTKKDSFNWHRASPAQLRVRSGILNAYYLPEGRGRSGLYDSITPMNSFRVIFNEYFGTGLPLLPDRTYAHETDYHPYRLVDITETVGRH